MGIVVKLGEQGSSANPEPANRSSETGAKPDVKVAPSASIPKHYLYLGGGVLAVIILAVALWSLFGQGPARTGSVPLPAPGPPSTAVATPAAGPPAGTAVAQPPPDLGGSVTPSATISPTGDPGLAGASAPQPPSDTLAPATNLYGGSGDGGASISTSSDTAPLPASGGTVSPLGGVSAPGPVSYGPFPGQVDPNSQKDSGEK